MANEIAYRNDDDMEMGVVNSGHPLPVEVSGLSSTVLTTGIGMERIYVEIPGITVADAFDANDTFGQLITFTGVARVNGGSGVITKAIFHDYDGEGINKTLYLFSRQVVIPVSDAAWTLADSEMRYYIGKVSFTSWDDFGNNQASVVAPALYYKCEPGSQNIYGAVQTAGVDNIATGSVPAIGLLVARD